ncbi:transposase [Paenibacillus ferrarius]|uniref:transposase n=1 Tax=Paenibacillus ferrarius TaxID=1469647 RepID=UPI003D27D74D
MHWSNLTLEQFSNQFATEEACVTFIYQSKWPHGFSCPRCQFRHAYVINSRRVPLYECSRCQHQTSLIAGTIMENSRTSLKKWLLAIYLTARSHIGTTAVELAKRIQVTYKTAWLMLHKIRTSIHLADQKEPLKGTVQINAGIYGKSPKSSSYKQPSEHLVLVGSTLNSNHEWEHVKIKHIAAPRSRYKEITRTDLLSFQESHLDASVTLCQAVTGFYTPRKQRPLLQFVTQASNWLKTTFHGIGPRHLQKYLDEFTYKLNLSQKNIAIFDHLLQICVTQHG